MIKGPRRSLPWWSALPRSGTSPTPLQKQRRERWRPLRRAFHRNQPSACSVPGKQLGNRNRHQRRHSWSRAPLTEGQDFSFASTTADGSPARWSWTTSITVRLPAARPMDRTGPLQAVEAVRSASGLPLGVGSHRHGPAPKTIKEPRMRSRSTNPGVCPSPDTTTPISRCWPTNWRGARNGPRITTLEQHLVEIAAQLAAVTTTWTPPATRTGNSYRNSITAKPWPAVRI